MELVGLKDEKQLIENSILNDHHVLLIGETGLGKTQLIKEFSTKLKKKLHRVSLNGEVGLNEILGRWLVKDGSTYWQDGVLLTSMKQGDWIVFDEINAALPEVLFCLNSLLDDEKSILVAEKDNEVVSAHKDFRFFATMNPSDSYVGTKDMNQALLSRFHLVIQMHDYDAKTEKEIIKFHLPEFKSDDVISLAITAASIVRKMKQDGDIMSYFSTRDLINMTKIVSTNPDIHFNKAINYSFINKLSRDEQTAVRNKLASSLGGTFNMEVSSAGISGITKFEKKIQLLQSEVSRLEVIKDGLRTDMIAKLSESLIQGKFDDALYEEGKKVAATSTVNKGPQFPLTEEEKTATGTLTSFFESTED